METTGAFDGARNHNLHIMSQTCNALKVKYLSAK